MESPAVFHRLRAGTLTGQDLLAYADAAVADADADSIDGIMADMGEGLSREPSLGADAGGSDVGRAMLCLEAAVRIGDAAQAVALTPKVDVSRLESATDVRLAVAAAHGRRILGDTAAALRIYTAVWERPTWEGPDADRLDPFQHRIAGHWAADLHMAQGRFAEAHSMAEEILAGVLDSYADAEVVGDLNRLLYLASRFVFDFDAAQRYLHHAEAAYRRAHTVVGLANVAVNQAELFAWTDPGAAVNAADAAIAKQQDIGAQHEIGKAYTAMAFAFAHLGDIRRGHAALDLACEALEHAGYRSGRARTELVRAVLHQRERHADLAHAAALHAVEEFKQVEVYPTFILLAERLLDLAGLPDAAVAAAADRASIYPLDSTADLDRRIRERTTALLNTHPVGANAPGAEPLADPLILYTTARSATAGAAGFYNHNVRLDTPAGPVIVRIPIDGADAMDLRIWPEHEVLRAIEPYVPAAPRVLQIHQCIAGVLLDATAPRGVPVPRTFTDDAAELFDRLGRVPAGDLPPLPRGWAEDGDTPAFARQLSDVTVGVWGRIRRRYAPLYAALGVPPDPLAPVLEGRAALTPRPFRLLHCDVHRKNVIIRPDGHATFLDWELALWGDPVYEVAVHLHKMTYAEAEERRLLDSWSSVLPGTATRAWKSDLARYLVHERIKSVLVDTVRYTKLIADPTANPARTPESLVRSLTTKLNAAGAIWGWARPTDEERVKQGVRGFLREQA